MGTAVGKIIGISGMGKPPGPHAVGSTTVRIPQGPHCRVFYPISVRDGRQEPYMRVEACHGLADGMGFPRLLIRAWSKASHPFIADAELLPGFSGPVVVFSHGLWGNCEMYSKICSDCASYGVLVIAPEHEDGSGCYALPEEANEPLLFHRPPANMAYNHETVTAFRRPFLEKRRSEVEATLRFLFREGAETIDASDIVLEAHEDPAPAPSFGRKLLRSFDASSSKIFLAGHSFGAASTVFTLRTNSWLREKAAAMVLLDIWSFSLDDEIIGSGLPVLPALSILSSQFALENSETQWTRDLIGNTDNTSGEVTSLYIPGTRHQQFSDMPWLMADWIARRVDSCGTLSKDESQEAIVRAMIRIFLPERSDETWDQILLQTQLEKFD